MGEKKFPPPPTRYGAAGSVQPKLGGASTRGVAPPPPPTRFGGVVQQQPAGRVSPGPVAPPPSRYGASGGATQLRTASPSLVAPPPFPPARHGGVATAQAKASSAPPPTRFGRSGAIQRMEIDDLEYESFGESGESETEGATLGIRGVVGKSKVHKHYRTKKVAFRNHVKTKKPSIFKSGNLKYIVDEFETGRSGANTHILVRHGGKATLHQANTANGVKLAIRKFKYKKNRITIGGDNRALGTRLKKILKLKSKVSNIHTEMNILYEKTGGDAKKVKNALTGVDVTVDKACCKMCYQWMKVANANVEDGSDFQKDGIDDRESFSWSNPFTGKSITKTAMKGMKSQEIINYVNDEIK